MAAEVEALAAAAAVAAARQDVGKSKCLSDSGKIELRKTFFLLPETAIK